VVSSDERPFVVNKGRVDVITWRHSMKTRWHPVTRVRGIWHEADDVKRLRVFGDARTFELPRTTRRTLMIGAAVSSDIRLIGSNGTIAPTHASLQKRRTVWSLRAAAEVACDGVIAHETVIVPGLEIRIGDVTLVAESDATLRVREYLGRVVGSSMFDIDCALRVVRDAALGRRPLLLAGPGSLVEIARTIHRLSLGDAPFIVNDPRRRNGEARGFRNHPRGLVAFEIAASGSVCVSGAHLPADIDETVARWRADRCTAQLIMCMRASDRVSHLTDLIETAPLRARRIDLKRTIDDAVKVTLARFNAPRSMFGARDRAMIEKYEATSPENVLRAVTRLVASRKFGVTRAAAYAGVSHAALSRWLSRREPRTNQSRRVAARVRRRS
jgi:hypothetical protein